MSRRPQRVFARVTMSLDGYIAPQRQPWERPGGTTFYFVNDGIESALERARDAAGGRDIRIAGGAETISQYLNARLVDELSIDLAPILLGGGTNLIRGIDHERVGLEIEEAVHSPLVTHVTYRTFDKQPT